MTNEQRQDLFEQWVTEYRALLHRTVRAFARPSDADDLRQELLMALWKAVPAFRSDSRASTFVYRVVHNAALTWCRTRRRRPLESLSEPGLVPQDPSSGGDEQLLDRLYEQIHALPPLDRSLMLLSLDDLGYEEIGAVLGMKANAVGVRLHRIRKQLLQQVKEQLDDT